MHMDSERPPFAPRPPMPETFRYRAPGMVPVWIPWTFNGGDWILLNRMAVPEFLEQHRAECPDDPAPEVMHDAPSPSPPSGS